jgi:hypothetical protein
VTGPPDVGTDDPDEDPEVPDWEDEYLDRVSDRIMFNYDLGKDVAIEGRTFDLYGQLRIETKRNFFTSHIQYGHHESYEHLFFTGIDRPDVADFESLVEFGHTLAERWVEGNEEHYQTDFTFVVVADEVPDDVRSFVLDFSDRTLLKYGFHGAYEIHLAVVSPDHEEAVASTNTDIVDAIRTWAPIEPDRGFFGRLKDRILG